VASKHSHDSESSYSRKCKLNVYPRKREPPGYPPAVFAFSARVHRLTRQRQMNAKGTWDQRHLAELQLIRWLFPYDVTTSHHVIHVIHYHTNYLGLQAAPFHRQLSCRRMCPSPAQLLIIYHEQVRVAWHPPIFTCTMQWSNGRGSLSHPVRSKQPWMPG